MVIKHGLILSNQDRHCPTKVWREKFPQQTDDIPPVFARLAVRVRAAQERVCTNLFLSRYFASSWVLRMLLLSTVDAHSQIRNSHALQTSSGEQGAYK